MHGYGLTPQAAAGLIAEFGQFGFGYREYRRDGRTHGVSLTNENYGISLISEAWLRDAFSACGLNRDAYYAQLWDDHHDIAVARLS